MKTIALTLALTITGCASTRTCPSAQEEAVSECRARKACKPNIFAMMLSGAGAGLSHQRSVASDNINDCIDRNMDAQRNNAGVKTQAVRCTSDQVSDDRIKTVCH